LNEKEAIERATADAFITLYNTEMGTSFSIVEYSDAPDVRCKDSEGNTFNLEITQSEDQPGDIQAAHGRSDQRTLERLKQHLSEGNPLKWVSCLQGNVTDMIVSRIQSKLQNDYGSSVALVVRDSSGLDWSWDSVTDRIKSALNLVRNPFDRGIWVIPNSKDRIFRLV
jgi:hypothetical protein